MITSRGFGGVYSEVIASQLIPSVHTIASTDISRQLTDHEHEQDDQHDRADQPDDEIEVDRRMVEVTERDLARR